MPFNVKIESDGVLHFCPINGTMIDWTPKHLVALHFTGHSTPETFGSPYSKYKKLSVPRDVQEIVQLTDEQFVALKNGGKRTPTKRRPGDMLTVNTPHTITTPTIWSTFGAAPNATQYHRTDRGVTKDLVREGDVGRYKSGTDIPNLKPNLAPSSKRHMPPGFAVDPAKGVKTVPAHPNEMNRDHMNNQAALLARGDKPSRGLAMAIPQWVHMNGYTFGDAAKPHTTKKRGPDKGLSRTKWISKHPDLGLFKEFMHELRVYHEAGQLDCEVVGSYRYMYRKHVALHGATHTNPQIAKLLMMYLHFAAHGVSAASL